MVHKFKTKMKEVGVGTGELFKGMAPVAVFPLYFKTAEVAKRAMTRAEREIAKKKRKRKKKRKSKKKKRKR